MDKSGLSDEMFKEPRPSLRQKDLKPGDKVRYQPPHYDADTWDNGVVKTIPAYTIDAVLVVYHCAENWLEYQDYTAALTYLKDLKKGWK